MIMRGFTASRLRTEREGGHELSTVKATLYVSYPQVAKTEWQLAVCVRRLEEWGIPEEPFRK
jgi:hypothetical protein